MNEERKHWLVRPENIRLLWRLFIVILALTVLLELPLKRHEDFVVDGWIAFDAVYGFIACVGMVVLAKTLGHFIKRHDHYYADNDHLTEGYRGNDDDDGEGSA